MTAEAIARVTTALQARLQAALTAAADPGQVFVGPFDDPLAQAATLSVFPYRIVPNASLRNTEHLVPTAGSPPYALYRNALPLDVYYLVSVGSRPSASEEPLLRVLGYAIQALQVDPVLPSVTVTPSSMHVARGPDAVRVTFEPLSTDEIGRLWALFPTANYRTSVAYVVSPVWIDPPDQDTLGPPVVQDALNAGNGPVAT
jgi:hypothetical protein